jgi:CMP/dCMP kinase
VTWLLRTAEVDAGVSIVSAYPNVRYEMVRRQRHMAAAGNIVMVGRDIGTVVLPEADLKIYLTASAEERARRRHKELQERGTLSSFEDILDSIQQRDTADSNRKASPLHPADDAVILDCTHKSIEETVEVVSQLIRERITRALAPQSPDQ